MPFHADFIAVILLTLSVLCACGRPPSENSSNSDSQKLPFDRQPRSTGISPSQSLIPSATKLPEGTPIPIRLQSALSSASSHGGDTFSAILDEAVVLDGQTLIDRGTPAIGRVLEAKPSSSSLARSLEPGYLRIVMVSLDLGSRPIMIETSTIFAKGGTRDGRRQATSTPSGAGQKDKDKDRDKDRDKDKDKDRDIVFGIDRRLNFHLVRAVDLQ